MKKLSNEQLNKVKGGHNGNHVSNGMYYPEYVNGKGHTDTTPNPKP